LTQESLGSRPSIFDYRSLDDIQKEIQEVYLSDNRPWVLGYSGGKDSTTALQLVWYAISELPEEKRTKPVFVISSDTLVETPIISDYITKAQKRINDAAEKANLPIKAVMLYPQIEDTFWVNLLGKGYPAPSITFRWCTERLKIRTADRFILNSVTEYGEVVLILGVRKEESATRAQVINLYQIEGSKLSHHSRFAQSYVYTPIVDFSVDDIWTYLLQKPCPWGSNNRDLLVMYKNAADGECPLVVDDSTAPCGNSRFGCWTCTVVAKDRSMEAMIESGEDWMEPLLDFRNLLAETQIPEKKHLYREFTRMNGQVKMKKDGSGIIRGPYKFSFCQELFRRLLEIQKQVCETGPDPKYALIQPEEIMEIRRIWQMQKGDWKDSAAVIYEEVTGEKLAWVRDDLGSYSQEEGRILDRVCERHGVPTLLVTRLLDLEQQKQGMCKRSSIYIEMDKILGKDWRTEEEVLASLTSPDEKGQQHLKVMEE